MMDTRVKPAYDEHRSSVARMELLRNPGLFLRRSRIVPTGARSRDRALHPGYRRLPELSGNQMTPQALSHRLQCVG
jgi:hypothetical protein